MLDSIEDVQARETASDSIRKKMRMKGSISLCVVALMATIFAVGGSSRAVLADEDGTTGVLKVQGSTTFNSRVLRPHFATIEKRIGKKISVIANKSIWGVIALMERRADVAMISARLAGEIDVIKRTVGNFPYEKLQEHNVSSTRIAFAVHPDNPIRDLAFAEVRKIFLGQISNWAEVGGPDLEIRIVAVQDGGGTVVAVRKQMLSGKPLAHKGAIRIESAKHVIKVVQQVPGAISIAQLGLLRAANLPEIKTERRVEQSLNLITIGKPSATVQAFIEATRSVVADEKS